MIYNKSASFMDEASVMHGYEIYVLKVLIVFFLDNEVLVRRTYFLYIKSFKNYN